MSLLSGQLNPRSSFALVFGDLEYLSFDFVAHSVLLELFSVLALHHMEPSDDHIFGGFPGRDLNVHRLVLDALDATLESDALCKLNSFSPSLGVGRFLGLFLYRLNQL